MRTFWSDESGAVTVDWVVMTAAIVGVGLATSGLVAVGVEDLGGDTRQHLVDMEPTDHPFVDNDGGGMFDWSSAALFGPDHSEAWRQDVMTNFYPNLTDGELNDYYAERQAEFAGGVGNYGNAVDHLGAAETEYARRGLTPPDQPGFVSFEDAAAQYQAVNG